MDLNYFKTQITEEIEGAENYYGQAAANEGTQWAETFRLMSKQELGHAKNLLTIMESCINSMRTAYDELSAKLKQAEENLT